jgi:hypothetical protein
VKRLIFASVVILALATLTFWGNRIAGRMLDAELGPLLTRELGLPVQLSPIKTKLLKLQANSPKLIMGNPQNPAVVATDVEVTLSLPALLHGEIRLKIADAADLMVRPSRWPSSNTPPPHDYHFLDQWLPRSLQLETGRYVSDSGDSYPLSQLHWQRQANGSATARWSEARTAGELTLLAKLKSLPDLLQLAPVEIELTGELAGKTDSQVSMKAAVQPGTKSAYALQIDLQGAGMTAHMTATGQTPWGLPDESETTIPLLETNRLLDLIKSYSESGQSDELAAQLASTLPQLQLPSHRGHVAINKILIADEMGKESAFDFTSGQQGLQISVLSSKGPTGILTGELGIVSDDQGWMVNMDATIQAREDDSSIAAQFLESDWLWRTGWAKLNGKGNTWGGLLNSLQGDISLAGHYRNEVKTPVTVNAQLDNRQEEFALDSIAITLGEGQVSGSAALSGMGQHKLTMDLKGDHLDMGFLFFDDDAQQLHGIALPEFLGFLPGVDLDVKLSVAGLTAPSLSLTQAQATLERTRQGGKLEMTGAGTHAGTIQLTLAAQTPPGQPDTFQLNTVFSQLDIPAMFRQQMFLHTRSSGRMDFQSQGHGIKEIFTAMQGKTTMTVEIRADDDWQRNSKEEENLVFSCDAHLLIDKDRILGVQIEKLDIDSIQQDLTGDLSLVSGREPWLVADLESEMLNVSGLLALLPRSTEEADDSDLLQSLRRLGAAQISLDIKSLIMRDLPLSDMHLEVASGRDVIAVKQFDFVTKNGTFKSQGEITWKNQIAKLESTVELSNVDLDQFLISSKDVEYVPVSGSAKLLSEGARIEDMVSNLTGYVDLQAGDQQQSNLPQSRRKLAMKASRLPDGMQAEISSLQWGESELSGSVRYRRTTPPSLDINIHSGTLSLLPWEKADAKANEKDVKRDTGATLGSAARASADFVGNVLLSPLRFISGDDKAAPGDKLFSNDPLPLDSLKNFNMKLSGQLDSLLSTVVDAKELSFNGELIDGQLSLKTSSGGLSDGTGEITVAVDSSAAPPTFKLTSTFENVRGLTSQNTFPHSGFISLDSRGQSQAEVAANISGLVYLELGQGPFDYANSTLLTANIATSVFQTLIPGIDHQKPKMKCGVTVGVFQDGIGATPYGFAARTNQANLLGRMHIDLGKETLLMSLDSRSRKGVGLSVGNVFSNTIQIKGPLTDPRIVPDATGLAWRGVAAFMTGSLSVLGESVFKRVLAADNPCTSIKKIIGKELCPKNPIAASSKMVCPSG